jgi:hypothetical protein
MRANDPMANYGEHMKRLGWEPGDGDYSVRSAAPTDSLDLRDTVMVCKICGTLLNHFRTPENESDWVHSRGWVKYDHEPEPVERPREVRTPDDMLCDFCGRPSGVNWKYTGDQINQVSGNLMNNYGHIWSGCDGCDEYIRQGDIEGLIDRVMRTSEMSRAHGAHKPTIRQSLMDLHYRFVPSITKREWIGGPLLPARLTYRMMPKIQKGLVKYWSHPELYERLVKPGFSYSVPGDVVDEPDVFRVSFNASDTLTGVEAREGLLPREVFQAQAARLRYAAEWAGAEGGMYWISSNFTTLAVAAGQELEDLSLSPENLPSESGIIVWEDPIGEIVRPNGIAAIRCMTWHVEKMGVQVNVYIQGEESDPDMRGRVEEMREEWGLMQSPNLGSGLPFHGWDGEKVSEEFRHNGNFILTLLATWFLIGQPGVATETVAPVDKKVERAYRRAGQKPPEVKVIDLRRHAAAAQRAAEAAEERRRVGVRFMVRGHWKRQAYGPKRGLRRQIYVAPFMKGPDGAPLKVTTPVVRVLR